MTDIVERLRKDGSTICREAADEIDRLQMHKRAQAEDIMTLGQQVGKLEAEIERLRGCLVEQQRNYEACGIALAASLAEIERLHAALKECSDELADQVEGYYAKTKDHPAMKRRYDRDMRPVLDARAALTAAHDTDEDDQPRHNPDAFHIDGW